MTNQDVWRRAAEDRRERYEREHSEPATGNPAPERVFGEVRRQNGSRETLTIVDGVCTEAGPTLRWAIGKSRDELRSYFARKCWRARLLPPAAVASAPVPP
jgi:hypothetical protein